MTAWVIFSPSLASASDLSFCKIMADTSGGLYSLPFRMTADVAVGGLGHLVGHELERLLDLGIVELAAHEALDREDGVLGIGDRLAAGHLTDEALARLGDDIQYTARSVDHATEQVLAKAIDYLTNCPLSGEGHAG